MFVDFAQVEDGSAVSSETTEDVDFDAVGVVIPVVVPDEDVAALLAAYDPGSATSPSAADSRVIARLVLDALKKAVEG